MPSSSYVADATNPSVSTGGVVVYKKGNGDIAQNNLAGDDEVIVISAATVAGLIPPVGFATLAFFLPAVSHDGTKVACHGQINVEELWTVGIDGSNPTQLTNFGTAANVTMRGSWSPDDSQIVFSRFDSTQVRQEIWRVDADGNNLTLIMSFGTTINAQAPCWGLNDVIVFIRKDGSDYQLWTMAPDGSGSAQLMTDLDLTGAIIMQPTWSADAVHIFVQYYLDVFDPSLILYKMDADGLNSVVAYDNDPNWSATNQGFAIAPPGTIFFIIAEEFSIFITIGPPRLPICRILYGLG